MGIEKVFDVGDTPYMFERRSPHDPGTAARQMIRDFFQDTPEGIVWAFYRRGFVKVQDGIRMNEDSTLDICREYFGGIPRPVRCANLENYLRGIDLVYLQLCGKGGIKAIGIESTRTGAQIGHYDFLETA